MKLSVPFYYDKFRCIAARCPDSCCVGWEISVDDDTLEYYRTVGGEIGKRLSNSIDNGVFRLTHDNKCPFLNKNGLCDIITELGEDALCNICARHPRFAEQYCDDTEIGLGMSCPECARIILGSEIYESYTVSRETSDEREIFGYVENDDDAGEYGALLRLRDEIFSIIRSSDSVYSACEKALDIALFSQNLADDGDISSLPDTLEEYEFSPVGDVAYDDFSVKSWLSILGNSEPVDDNWHELYKSALNSDLPVTKANNSELSRIFAYFVYRYLLTSLFDGDIYGKMKLCVFSTVICAHLISAGCGGLPSYRIAALYSKQAEYSQDCLDMLYREFDDSDIFDYDHFVYLLRNNH